MGDTCESPRANCSKIANLLNSVVPCSYFMFPETKGIPVETTHAVFKDHKIWTRLYPEIREVHAVDVVPATAEMPISNLQKPVV